LINVLFVCLGNICRSPTAEGVFRDLVEREGLSDKISIDSAGIGRWHVGEPPDSRATSAAKLRGIDISLQRARTVEQKDFRLFDYIVAMDQKNHRELSLLCPVGQEERLHKFLQFASNLDITDVPDPYYGGAKGFDDVLDMIEIASIGLLDDIRNRYL
tara:strand:+ start:246 stop:719 length:474 start_codon:yes stop_codon:yes gene_type:complete